MCGHTCMYVLCYYVCMSMYVFVYHRVYMVACCSDSDSLMRSELDNERFRFVLVVDPIHWRFEDRPIEWSGDSYQFVQWRPNGDSDPKSRHFMWVFALYLFLIYRCKYYLYATCIISCDHLIHFISMITRIISCGTSECSFWLYSLSECLSASFHVLFIRRYWLRTSCDIS